MCLVFRLLVPLEVINCPSPRGILLELLHDGLISPSHSPFAAPAFLVKKADRKYWLDINYHKLNQYTVKDSYTHPTVNSVFDSFGGAADSLHSATQYRPSKRWAYYQLRMGEESWPLTAFKTPLGSFTWNVMPMGVPNAPAAFQRLMDSIFRDLPFVSCYFDDVVIHSHSAEEHLRHLAIVFERLHQHSLLTRFNKCKKFQSSIPYYRWLGYTLTQRSFKPSNSTPLRDQYSSCSRFSASPLTISSLSTISLRLLYR